MAARVQVHKAVEPDNLSVKGKKRYQRLLADLIANGGTGDAILQPKHDGVYVQMLFVDGQWRGYSRTGVEYTSLGDGSERGIVQTFTKHAFTERGYNGELWMPTVPFADINGRARRKAYQYQELVLFDSFQLPHLNPLGTETYDERREYLFEGFAVSKVRDLTPTDLFTESDVYELARDYKARSAPHDGLMLKDRNGLYVPGHGKDGETIKIKPRKSGDFMVVAQTEGQGNRKGGIGALVVDLGNGVRSEVGTGLTMVDVFERNFIGKVVEVEYLSITKDGRLREPAFLRVRDDKTEGDVLTHTEVGDDD